MKRSKKPDYISQKDWDAVDSPELSDAFIARMKPVQEAAPELIALQRHVAAQRGRPKAESTKKLQSLRLSERVISHFKAQGTRWQTRINDVLESFVDKAENASAQSKITTKKPTARKSPAQKSLPKKAALRKVAAKKP